MTEPLTLTVSTEFFASDFVPPVCLFSGETADVQKAKVRLSFAGTPHKMWYQIGIDPATRWSALIKVPANPRQHAAWSVWEAARVFCLVLCMILGGLLFHRSLVSRAPGGDPLMGLHGILWTTLLFVATGSIAFAAWLQKRNHLVRLTAAEQKNAVLIRFPHQLSHVHQIYQAAWQSYMAAGQPPPSPVAKDEDWENSVKTGWDGCGGTIERDRGVPPAAP